MTQIDQYTRWLCAKCGNPGIDSWNKAMHDGVNYGGEYPNPAIFGDTCQSCGQPIVVAYSTPDTAPIALYGAPKWASEAADMDRIEADPACGETLQASDKRDADWSHGCCAPKGPLH